MDSYMSDDIWEAEQEATMVAEAESRGEYIDDEEPEGVKCECGRLLNVYRESDEVGRIVTYFDCPGCGNVYTS